MHFPAHKSKSWVRICARASSRTYKAGCAHVRIYVHTHKMSLSLFLPVIDTSSYSRIRYSFLVISLPAVGSRSGCLNTPNKSRIWRFILLRHGALPISKVSPTFRARLQSGSGVLTCLFRPTGDGGKNALHRLRNKLRHHISYDLYLHQQNNENYKIS